MQVCDLWNPTSFEGHILKDHTEHNVWQNTCDVIYHEAIQQEIMDSFLDC